MTEDLSDRQAVVTGGSQGLGLGIVEALVERGARVTVVARDGARLTEVSKRLGVDVVRGDVTDPDVAKSVLSDIRPTVLVLDAGSTWWVAASRCRRAAASTSPTTRGFEGRFTRRPRTWRAGRRCGSDTVGDEGAGAVGYVIVLEFSNGTVSGIRDFRYTRYAAEGLRRDRLPRPDRAGQ